MFWWQTDPSENLFMEVTRRDDIGGDLEAPLLARGGSTSGSYALVPEVRENDVILHYDGESQAIVGASLAVGGPEPTSTYWVARGVSARRAGAEASWLPGIRVPISHYTALDPPITLTELRRHEPELMQVREDLRQTHGPRTPLYFPWTPYANGAKPMRTFESYLVKVPRRAIDIVPDLRRLVDAVEAARVGTIPATPEVDRAENAVADVAGRPSARRGHGYQLDQQIKVAVEVHAMNAATAFYGRDHEVRDVHSHESFDLVCIASGVEKHVEVKGTTTGGAAVVLTRNEVEHANTHRDVALFVLADIIVERTEEGGVIASGGREIVHDPWSIAIGSLQPIGYKYVLPRD